MTERVGLVSLGCAKNLVNSEQMLYLLKSAGFEVSGETSGAGIVIVNTCGFIESAKTEAIETILEIAAEKASGGVGKIIVAGCLAERYKDEIFKEMPEVDALVGTGSFGDIVNVVRAVQNGENPAVFGDINAPSDETERIITTFPSWAYIKIAEGCDNRCAYCVIPDIRGRFRSRPMENIVKEANDLAAKGIKELIIVAQDVTRYGLDLYGERRLFELLTRLSEIENLSWIRLHYLYPDEIDEKLIEVISKNGKILKYLDIPIQHINDGILQKMRRRGSGDEIRELFRHLRKSMPGLVLRTSVITGLPGESETEFEELCTFLEEMKIERAGVFAYSPEEGSEAAEMDRPDSVVAEYRAEQISQLQSRVIDEFNLSRVGSVVTVLVEGYTGTEYLARSYAESPDIDGVIHVKGSGIAVGEFIDIRIIGTQNGELAGEVIVYEHGE